MPFNQRALLNTQPSTLNSSFITPAQRTGCHSDVEGGGSDISCSSRGQQTQSINVACQEENFNVSFEHWLKTEFGFNQTHSNSIGNQGTLDQQLFNFKGLLSKYKKLQLENEYLTECTKCEQVPKGLPIWKYPTGLQKDSHLHKELVQFFNRFEVLLYQVLLSMVFALQEINNNQLLLQNQTLGFLIYDSCYTESAAIDSTFQLLSGQRNLIPNYCCKKYPPVAAVIGDLRSSETLPVARILSLYKFPQISPASAVSILSDKHQFPSFLRTVPTNSQQPLAIFQLLRHYQWEWVGLIATDSDYGLEGIQLLKEKITKYGFCFEFYEIIAPQLTRTKVTSLVQLIKRSSATVIVMYVFLEQLIPLMEEITQQNITGKIWVASGSWVTSSVFAKKNFWTTLDGTVGIIMASGSMPGFKEFLYTIHPNKFPNDVFMKLFWERVFQCKWTDNKTYQATGIGHDDNIKFCTGQEKLQELEQTVYPVSDFRYHYCITSGSVAPLTPDVSVPETLTMMVVNQRHSQGGAEVESDTDVDMQQTPAIPSDIDSRHMPTHPSESANIGQVEGDALDQGSVLTVAAVPDYSVAKVWVPKSMCSEACHPGYRRVLRQGEPPCCFDCIPCSDGEISNASDMYNCMKCPQDYWTNSAKMVCIKKYLEFLSYEDPLGISLAMTAVVSSLVPVVVLCIFIKHHNTPVVKANNREVSYFLLVTLTLCLLTALIFIGPPNNETCIFRQTAFGIFFSICVSSVLAKTITVVIAFNATKPGSHLKSLVGSKTSFYIIFCCFSFQFIICIIWLSISPPFSDTDKTLPGKILIQCNEGSIFMFYCMLGYLGMLATVSLIIAFLARNLPDGFNEARFITFSMIVFISVWLSFVPAYISTRGMYMVAVEVFAILSSSIGLLLCIFLPKCYIILIRPSKNTRGYIVRPQNTLFKA
ncbi:extracellular calcium-sensing receptor-like [Protopterus annectens]|uniref:extracellular calcium-sensing receptor-like n=1 Tax=Protopterus annectens TaxID=7888 RepID=UPI001CFB7D2D|nr:extracellular calcium-sensing receptor-like [Protopterus annectens]